MRPPASAPWPSRRQTANPELDNPVPGREPAVETCAGRIAGETGTVACSTSLRTRGGRTVHEIRVSGTSRGGTR
jgi:hypothetical protein